MEDGHTGGRQLISDLLQSCLQLVLPPACRVCGLRLPVERGSSFCDSCKGELRFLTAPQCRSCGTEVSVDSTYAPLCGECLTDPPPYLLARSVVRYEQLVRQLVHKLKYQGEFSVLPAVAELLTDYDLSEFLDIDYIVPVPLHPSRLRRRGFNQALILSRLFFPERIDLIRYDWLVRTRNTVPQTGLMRRDRKKNVKGAFWLRQEAGVRGAVICLVDDVFTTGTTVKECSRTILDNGAAGVKVLTLARVHVSHRGRVSSF